MTRSTLVLMVTLLLAGCGRYKEARWPDHAARVSCKTALRCDSADFWFNYDSLDACITDTIGTTAPTDGCTYDKKSARDCIHDMKWSCRKIGARYDDLQTDCAGVWTCPEPTDPTGTGPKPLR